MARPELVENLRILLQQLTAFSADSRVFAHPDSRYRFEEARDEITGFLSFAGRLSSIELHQLTDSALRDLTAILGELFSMVQRAAAFDPHQPSAITNYNELISMIRSKYYALRAQYDGPTAYAIASSSKLSDLFANYDERMAHIGERAMNAVRNIDEAVAKATAAAQKAEDVLAKVRVADESKAFGQEAAGYRKHAMRWLWSAVVFAGAFVALAWRLHVALQPDENLFESYLRHVVARAPLLTISLFALFWAARNYRSSWHNYVVNRHRQRALETFESFVDAATTKEARMTILIAAANAIFSPQRTGYLKDEPEVEQTIVSDLVQRVSRE